MHNMMSCCVGIIWVDVMTVAGRYQRNPQSLGNLDGTLERDILQFDAVVHDLDKITVAENSVEPLRHFCSFRELIFHAGAPTQNRPAKFSGNASAETNDSFAVLFEQLFVHARA